MNSLWEDAPLRLALESLVLEQWLRFYWLEEAGGVVRLCPSQDARSQIAEKAPQLLPLFDDLAAKEVDAQAACAAVAAFVGEAFPNDCAALFASPEFQAAVVRFQAWVFEQADLLDTQEADFSLWVREAFAPAEA